jgi:hypothetical protein
MEKMMVVSCFAVFLCGFAPLREKLPRGRIISRKDAKAPRLAKRN